MSWLRRRRPILAGLVPVLGLAILVIAPRYLAAQGASDAAGFRAVIPPGHHDRYAVAALVDVVFASAYGLAALAFTPDRSWTRPGAALIAAAAVADIGENVFVLSNALRIDAVTDDSIALMRGAGTVKTTLLATGLIAVTVGAFLNWRRGGK